MSTTTPTANSILMSGGGQFAAFKSHGDTVTGTVVNIGDPYHVREWNQLTQRSDGPPKYSKAGKPVWAFHVTLSTDERSATDPEDDGTRTVDVNSWRMQDALRAAIKAAGAPGLEVGAQLTLTYTHDEVNGDPRSGKYFQARYVRPANVALMGGNASEAGAGGQPVPHTAAPVSAPQAQPYQPPAPAPAPAAAAGGPSAADKAKQLIAVGLDDTTIAAAVGLDASVIAILRAA